jgi:L-lactate dehydrogenase complex protein LldE
VQRGTVRVALFVPCYVDQLFPEVGLAAAELLERHGATVEFPFEQTCCGQPHWSAGHAREARPLAERFARVFAGFEHVVAPSGSCVAMVRRHYAELAPAAGAIAPRVRELCEFLVDVLGVTRVPGRFPHRVGLHASCHAGSPERVRALLACLDGIELVLPSRGDECCGFGGSFCVGEEAVSCLMGLDRLADHERAGAEIVTSVDSSCLAHLAGLVRRRGSGPRTMHVAEILAGREPPP